MDLTLQYMTDPPKVYNDNFAPMPPREAQQNPEIVRYQLETSELIENLRMLLLNEIFVQDKETGIISRQTSKYGTRLMNEDGVQEILTIIRPHLDKNIILSNLTDDEISSTLIELRSKIALLLQNKYKVYEIEKAKLPTVMTTIINPIWSTLKRAANETTLNYLGKTQQLHEIRRHDDSDKESFMQKFMNPFNKK